MRPTSFFTLVAIASFGGSVCAAPLPEYAPSLVSFPGAYPTDNDHSLEGLDYEKRAWDAIAAAVNEGISVLASGFLGENSSVVTKALVNGISAAGSIWVQDIFDNLDEKENEIKAEKAKANAAKKPSGSSSRPKTTYVEEVPDDVGSQNGDNGGQWDKKTENLITEKLKKSVKTFTSKQKMNLIMYLSQLEGPNKQELRKMITAVGNVAGAVADKVLSDTDEETDEERSWKARFYD